MGLISVTEVQIQVEVHQQGRAIYVHSEREIVLLRSVLRDAEGFPVQAQVQREDRPAQAGGLHRPLDRHRAGQGGQDYWHG